MAGEELDKKKTLPIATKTFELFLENKTFVEKCHHFRDLGKRNLLQIYSEFLLLQNKGRLAEILDKDKDYQASLLNLHDYINENNIDIQHGLNIVDFGRADKEFTTAN